MTKTILASIGLLAVVGAIAIWQFGFFSQKAKDVSLKVDRATAVARANDAIAQKEAAIAKMDETAHKYRVEAKKLEIANERDQAAIDELESAMKKLTSALKEKGLGASDENTLTEEKGAIVLTFGAKSVTAREAYATLSRWTTDRAQKKASLERKKTTSERMCKLCQDLEAKKGELNLAIGEMRAKLSELEVSRDMAKVEAELAEMEASVNGVAVAGDAGKAFETIQNEIDELNATVSSFEEEAQIKTDSLNPSDLTAKEKPSDAFLDSLWNE